jgi:hypothetical protein
MRRTKAQAEAAHFRRRLLERYGIAVNHGAYRELCREAFEAPLILKESGRLCIVLLVINGHQVPCIFDRMRGRLVSALHPRRSLIDAAEKRSA